MIRTDVIVAALGGTYIRNTQVTGITCPALWATFRSRWSAL